jgi:hypothetical protein
MRASLGLATVVGIASACYGTPGAVAVAIDTGLPPDATIGGDGSVDSAAQRPDANFDAGSRDATTQGGHDARVRDAVASTETSAKMPDATTREAEAAAVDGSRDVASSVDAAPVEASAL